MPYILGNIYPISSFFLAEHTTLNYVPFIIV